VEKPDRAEVVKTIEHLNQAADSRPALQTALDQLTPKETVALATALTVAKPAQDAKLLRNLVASTVVDPQPDPTPVDPPSVHPARHDLTPSAASSPTFDGFRTASLRLDQTGVATTVAAPSGPASTATSAQLSTILSASSQGGQDLPTASAVKDEAGPVALPTPSTGVSPADALLAVPVALDQAPLSSDLAAESDSRLVVATASGEMMEANLPMDGSALEAFVASLDRLGQSLGLPAGAGMPVWMTATALALAACELARRQLRATRHAPALSADDASDTLTWSLSLR